jgi:hypothetical protein
VFSAFILPKIPEYIQVLFLQKKCPYLHNEGQKPGGHWPPGQAVKKSTSLRGGRSPTWQSPKVSGTTIGADSKIDGIATPVCALARNDVVFFTC